MLYCASAGQHAVFAKDLRSPDNAIVVAGEPGKAGNMKVEGIGGDGSFATAARLFNPLGLAAGEGGELYIADAYNGRVREVKGGIINTVAGADQSAPRGNRGGAKDINIGQPRGVTCTPFGLFVTASPGIVWNLMGNEMIPVAGTWVDGYNGDEGDATEVRLNTPCGVAWWGKSIAVADSDNGRICRVSLN